MPVDLAVLTKEKPTGWIVGSEMEHQAALQTMLRAFRSSFASTGMGMMAAEFNRARAEATSF